MKSIKIEKVIEDAFIAGMMHMLCSNQYFKQIKPDKAEYVIQAVRELKNVKIEK